MPVRDFLQDELTGGFAIRNGDFAKSGGDTLAENVAAVKQNLRIATRLFKGECYLDDQAGVDYREKVLVKNPDPTVVAAEIGSNIATVVDVTGVVSAGLVGPDANRDASIDYSVTTPYTANPVTGSVPTP